LKRTSDKSLFPMALGSCGHRITHQLRPINMNGRSILAVTSSLRKLSWFAPYGLIYSPSTVIKRRRSNNGFRLSPPSSGVSITCSRTWSRKATWWPRTSPSGAPPRWICRVPGDEPAGRDQGVHFARFVDGKIKSTWAGFTNIAEVLGPNSW